MLCTAGAQNLSYNALVCSNIFSSILLLNPAWFASYITEGAHAQEWESSPGTSGSFYFLTSVVLREQSEFVPGRLSHPQTFPKLRDYRDSTVNGFIREEWLWATVHLRGCQIIKNPDITPFKWPHYLESSLTEITCQPLLRAAFIFHRTITLLN